MNFEICTDNVEGAIVAGELGAKRIELCSALSVGGLTPNYGLIQQCVEKSSVEVHVMIRHKVGGFCYSDKDVELMKIDVVAAKNAGAHGVVFGILTPDNKISLFNKELAVFSKELGFVVTFHRAFDFISDYNSAIIVLIEFGFDRLLTSGLQETAVEGIDVIQEIQQKYGNFIQIMAGSGVNSNTALKLASTGINNLHFTSHKPLGGSTGLSMGELMVVDKEKIESIMNLF